MSTAIELKHITKTFASGKIVANKDVNLDVQRGEILSLLGENGSGKTTLMNMISGIYFPDEGQIFIDGKEVVIRSPKDAYAHKIGMIHQHFKLVDVFSAADNIILGEKFQYDMDAEVKKLCDAHVKANREYEEYNPDEHIGALSYMAEPKPHSVEALRKEVKALKLDRLKKYIKFNWLAKNRAAVLQDIASKYGFDIDLKKKIYDMSVSEKQTVEIIKVLYRGADILILDEPTAVLTPQEIKKLFDVLRKMREDGKSIIIITHKLNEVMEISDRVAILRKGEHIATVSTSETNEKELTEMMVGKKVSLNIDRSEPHDVEDRLVVRNLSATSMDGVKVLDDVSFEARSGEILGVAGIAGSGQKELLEAIAGLQRVSSGSITYYDLKEKAEKVPKLNENGEPVLDEKGKPTYDVVHSSYVDEVNLRSKTPMQIRNLGVRLSFVPEDRLGMGLVGNMDLVDNMMLRSYRKGFVVLDRKRPKNLANKVVENLEVSTPSIHTPVRRLSGGNVQKVLVGREIASAPKVLMAAYPVRGLDINSSYTIYNLLNEQKEKGVAVIFVGEDLDVLIELCDRIMVICGGKVTGIVDGRTAVKEEIGLLMTKTDSDDSVSSSDVANDEKANDNSSTEAETSISEDTENEVLENTTLKEADND